MQQSTLGGTQARSAHTGGWVPASQGAQGMQSLLEPEWQMLNSAWNCSEGKKRPAGGRGRGRKQAGGGDVRKEDRRREIITQRSGGGPPDRL